MTSVNIKFHKDYLRSIKLTKKLSEMRLNEKIKKNAICGRVLDISKDRVYIADENMICEIYSDTLYELAPGDLVSIDYKKINNKNTACNITKIQSVKLNPIEIKKSPFNKLTDDSYRLRKLLDKRSLFFKGVHSFFTLNSFVEVNTPTLVESPGVEKYLGFFKTQYINNENQTIDYFMPTSPEFSLKEALSSGLSKIYEICKSFRNMGEVSANHRPEFMMLEWYRTNVGYETIIDDCAKIALYLSMLLYKRKTATFKGVKIDLSKYQVYTLRELFEKHGVNLDYYTDKPDIFIEMVKEALKTDGNGLTKEDLFFKFMLDKIEPSLGFEYPVFITEYPYEMTPLSERSDKNPLYGKRFEMYICGVELANGYGELTDFLDQKKRFDEVIKERLEIGGEPLPNPKRFLNAMKQGIMPCSGVAMGLERLFMVLTDTASIEDTKLIDML